MDAAFFSQAWGSPGGLGLLFAGAGVLFWGLGFLISKLRTTQAADIPDRQEKPSRSQR